VTPPPAEQRIRALPKYEPVRSHDGDERTYATPVGQCPSVTTILSGSRDQSGLEAWRESVGTERADFISSLACHRGNRHHEAIERFLLDGTEPDFCLLNTPYWKSTRPFLDTIDQPLLMEGALWHPLKFAGTFDCIAYLADDGDQPTLLDWKTADAIRKPNKMYEYGVQVSAYVAAANHVYGHLGLNITQAKIVVALPDESPQIETLDARALEQLFKHFQARLQRFTFARSKKRGGKK
jgi:genome maintenance exonuclease 1